MLHEEEGPDGVYGEGLRDVGVVQLRGGFFRIKDPRDGEGEVEVVLFGEHGFGVFCCSLDAVFIC